MAGSASPSDLTEPIKDFDEETGIKLPFDDGSTAHSSECMSSHKSTEAKPHETISDHDVRLDDETRDRINSNRVYLITNLNTGPCIDFLQSRGFINPDMFDDLESQKSSPREQVNSLMFLVGRSKRLFNAFILSLRDSNQQAIIERLVRDGNMAVASPTNYGLLSDIKESQHLILENVRFEGSFLAHLEGRRVLTTAQVDELISIPTRRARAQRLLRLVEKGETAERTQGLVSALLETDQPHLAMLIETGDESQILPKRVKECATKGKVQLIEGIRKHVQRKSMSHVLSKLEDINLITSAQSEAVQAAGDPDLQYQQLVDMITCRPLAAVRDTLLADPQTSHVTICLPALEEHHNPHKEIPDEQTYFSTYIHTLKTSVKEEATKKNKQLNERFGIYRDTVLYCELAMATQLRGLPEDGVSSAEEYIRQTAQSLKIKERVSIDNIFDSDGEEESPRRLLLLGGAGMGKTTVLQELSRRWADGELGATEPLAYYMFECRSFTHAIKKEKEFSLADLLFRLHRPGNLPNKDIQTLTQFIIEHESEILIAIDGLDELVDWKSCGRSTPEICDVSIPGEIHHILYNLIHKRLLPRSTVIVTTRPIRSVKHRDFERCLVSLGFSEAAIKDCMRALCHTEELAQEVIDYIYRTNLVADCTVPLTSILLGVVLRQDLSQKSGNKLPSSEINSMTRLYCRVSVECVWRRVDDEADSLLDLTEKQKTTLLKLAKLASLGMLGKNTVIVFDNSHLKAVDIKADEDLFGLLEVSHSDGPYRDYQRPYTASFLHLTVQEFLAALHVATAWDPAHTKRLCKSGTQRLDMVRMFVCGLLGDPQCTAFLNVFDPGLTNQNKSNRLRELLMEMNPNEDEETTRLHILRCLAEGKLSSMVHTLKDKFLEEEDGLYTLDLDDVSGGILPHHLAAVGYSISECNVDRLRLANSEINPRGVHTFVSSSQRVNCLKNLWLSNNSLGDDGVTCLAPLITSNHGLLDLRLDENELGNDAAKVLADTLKDHPSIRELYVDGNNISDEGAIHLANLLETNYRIQLLNLRLNRITDIGAYSLVNVVKDQMELQELDLRDNKLTIDCQTNLKDKFKEKLQILL